MHLYPEANTPQKAEKALIHTLAHSSAGRTEQHWGYWLSQCVCCLFHVWPFYPLALSLILLVSSSAPHFSPFGWYDRGSVAFTVTWSFFFSYNPVYSQNMLLLIMFIYLFQVGSFSLFPHWIAFPNLFWTSGVYCHLSVYVTDQRSTQTSGCLVQFLLISLCETDVFYHDGTRLSRLCSLISPLVIILFTLCVIRSTVNLLTVCNTKLHIFQALQGDCTELRDSWLLVCFYSTWVFRKC